MRGFPLKLRVADSVFLIVALCALNLPRADNVLWAQSRLQSNSDLLSAKQKRFVEYAEDFLDFAKSASDLEHELTMDLETAASQASERLDAVVSLLDIYDSLSCKEDRAKIKLFLQKKFPPYSRLLENSIKQVNLDISHIRTTPGVAAEAIRMREDLREAKDILDSVKLP